MHKDRLNSCRNRIALRIHTYDPSSSSLIRTLCQPVEFTGKYQLQSIGRLTIACLVNNTAQSRACAACGCVNDTSGSSQLNIAALGSDQSPYSKVFGRALCLQPYRTRARGLYHRIDKHSPVVGLNGYPSVTAGCHYTVFGQNICDPAFSNCSNAKVISVTVSQITTVIDLRCKDFNIITVTGQIDLGGVTCRYNTRH